MLLRITDDLRIVVVNDFGVKIFDKNKGNEYEIISRHMFMYVIIWSVG